MDFQKELTEKAKLERKGPAVLAAGVFDIKNWILDSVTPVARGRRISSALRAQSRHRAEPAAGN